MNIEIKVIPSSKKREIIFEDNNLKIKLISKPQDGKANKELIETLSKKLKIAKSKIKIIRGEKTRNKIIEIEGIENLEEIRYKLLNKKN